MKLGAIGKVVRAVFEPGKRDDLTNAVHEIGNNLVPLIAGKL